MGTNGRAAAPSRPRTRSAHLSCALLLALVMIVGMGKGWAQCTPYTPQNYAGTVKPYNDNCSAPSVTFEHTGAVGDDGAKVLWDQHRPPVAYSAKFGNNGNFQFSNTNTVIGHGTAYLSYSNTNASVTSDGDVNILMYNLGSFDPNVYKYFVIHYQVTDNNSSSNKLEIFFTSATDGVSADRSLTMTHNTSNVGPYTVVIDASVHPKWTTIGNITGWRLDPVHSSNGKVTIVIDYIALTSVAPTGSLVDNLTGSYNSSDKKCNFSMPTHPNGADVSGYSATKTINNYPQGGTTWYSDRLRGWSCNTSSIKHVFCGFNAGAITSGSNTICYNNTAALSEITQSAAPDGTAPYSYQWKDAYTHNGTTTETVISGATDATYTPDINTYKTQDGTHVFTRWVKDASINDYVQSTGQYTLTVRPQVAVHNLLPSASPNVTYGDPVDIQVVTSPYGIVSTPVIPNGVSYDIGDGHIKSNSNTLLSVGSYPYTVSVTDDGGCGPATASGTITVSPRSVTLTCPSGSNITKTYNGAALNPAATVTGTINNESAGIQYREKTGGSWSAWSTNVPSITNAGTKDVEVKITNSNYTASGCAYTLTVNRKAVTITAGDASKTYDGTALTQSSFTPSSLESGDNHQFSVAMTSASTITNYGTQSNVIATVDGVAVTTGTQTVVGNYLVTTENGTLTINRKQVTITVNNSSKTYGENGTMPAHTMEC